MTTKAACSMESIEELYRAGKFAEIMRLSKLSKLETSENPNLLYKVASSFFHLGEFHTALELSSRALYYKEDPAYYHLRGEVYRNLQETQKSLQDLKKALQLSPLSPEILTCLSTLYSIKGDFKQSKYYLQQAIQISPIPAHALYEMAQIQKLNHNSPYIRQMENLLFDPRCTLSDKTLLNYALGKVYDDNKNPDKAFFYFRAANQLAGVSFELEEFKKRIENLKQTFTRAFFASSQIQGHPSPAPIFIVGMPRSGTTLTERILGNFPQVLPCGERLCIRDYVKELRSFRIQTLSPIAWDPNSACYIQELTQERASHFAKDFLAVLQNFSRITDKMPGNYIYLGLIALLFPHAKVIHCKRDPLDTCLSCYFQKFLSPSLSYSNDLKTLGAYYLQYQTLMEHWKEVLPLPICEIQYESTTQNPEETGKKLAEFCELPWTPEVLKQREQEGEIHTASRWQARQPIYRSSVRKSDLYKKHLVPLMEALGL